MKTKTKHIALNTVLALLVASTFSLCGCKSTQKEFTSDKHHFSYSYDAQRWQLQDEEDPASLMCLSLIEDPAFHQIEIILLAPSCSIKDALPGLMQMDEDFASLQGVSLIECCYPDFNMPGSFRSVFQVRGNCAHVRHYYQCGDDVHALMYMIHPQAAKEMGFDNLEDYDAVLIKNLHLLK